MSVLKAVNFGIKEEIARKRRKRRRREVMFYILKIAGAVLFVVGIVLSVINFIENTRRRLHKDDEQRQMFRRTFEKKRDADAPQKAADIRPAD